MEILDGVFKKFSKLHIEIRETFSKVLIAKKTDTLKILENLIRCEENYLFTNDPKMLDTGRNLTKT